MIVGAETRRVGLAVQPVVREKNKVSIAPTGPPAMTGDQCSPNCCTGLRYVHARPLDGWRDGRGRWG